MKKLTLFCFFVFSHFFSGAQTNLVKNGGFEEKYFCPSSPAQMGFCKYWTSIDTTWTLADSVTQTNFCQPEYCNACAGLTSTVNIPHGEFFDHYARSGEGMVQILVLNDSTESHIGFVDYRSHPQGRFIHPLTSGRDYCVTFYVCLERCSQSAIKTLGAYIDDGSIDSNTSADCLFPRANVHPQIMATDFITDTLNWTKLQGHYTATGREKFITFGNFRVHDSTPEITTHFEYSDAEKTLYLLDDVSVIESNATANAGIDRISAVGDSVWVGTSEQGMPSTWYACGDTTHALGYSGGMWVHPTATGVYRYVMMLDLCGHITWDTMTLTVYPMGVPLVPGANQVLVYPNPATTELKIEAAKGFIPQFTDVLGRNINVTFPALPTDHETLDISQLPAGNYHLQLFNPSTGARLVQRVIKFENE